MGLPQPPHTLVTEANDPQLREVLADWYRQHGHDRWARMMEHPIRWTELRAALKDAGLALRQLDSPFLWLEQGSPSLGMRSLAWRVRDPGWAGPLLGTPVWASVRSVHLLAWRPRTAVPSVLSQLSNTTITTLEVAGQSIDPGSLANDLERLGCRLARATRPATLNLGELALSLAGDADLQRLERLDTPRLRTLHLRAPGGFDGPTLDVARALDRPLQTITVDRACAQRYAKALEQRSPERLIDVDRRWYRAPEDRRRWFVDG